ncbi:MAG: hypothetical protein IPP99_12420 [Chitinophagaceae bacterium]|nr:hypothetical protein [Chitinophagaceae bacterium]
MANNANPSSTGAARNNKKRWKRSNVINLVIAIVAVLTFGFGIYTFALSRSEKVKTCDTLKEREKLVAASIEEYKTKREQSTNKDYNERVYDFKIANARAVLQNIRDSLNLLLCEK